MQRNEIDFYSLPRELILYIFSFLSNNDIKSAMLLNSPIYAITQDDFFWRKKIKNDFFQEIPDGINPKEYYRELVLQLKKDIQLFLDYMSASESRIMAKLNLEGMNQDLQDIDESRVSNSEIRAISKIKDDMDEKILLYKDIFHEKIAQFLPQDQGMIRKECNEMYNESANADSESSYFINNLSALYMLLRTFCVCHANLALDMFLKSSKLNFLNLLPLEDAKKLALIAASFGNLHFLKHLHAASIPLDEYASERIMRINITATPLIAAALTCTFHRHDELRRNPARISDFQNVITWLIEQGCDLQKQFCELSDPDEALSILERRSGDSLVHSCREILDGKDSRYSKDCKELAEFILSFSESHQNRHGHRYRRNSLFFQAARKVPLNTTLDSSLPRDVITIAHRMRG